MMFERCDRNPLVVHRGRHTIPTLLILACALAATAPARSQEVPAGRPTVTIVHPFAPGGVGYDLGHVIGDRFRRLFNIPVIVEAKPGVNTVLGVTSVVKSRPDGQTLLINSASITAIAGTIYKAQPYNPATDLVPVAFVAQVPLVLVVSAELPVKSLDGLVQLARKTPKGLSYASTGVGSAQHISLESLKRALRIDMTHVPFRGPIPALTAVAGGHTELMLIDVLNAASLIEAGKVRPIALTTAAPLDVFRGVPIFAEAGLQGFEVDLRFLIFAAASTPSAIVAQLNSNIRTAIDDPAVRERFGKVGVQVRLTPDPQGVAAIYRDELDRWYRMVKEADLANTQ
jgi:tripartite-type tricarboxylate transporter receptor subunit TctC